MKKIILVFLIFISWLTSFSQTTETITTTGAGTYTVPCGVTSITVQCWGGGGAGGGATGNPSGGGGGAGGAFSSSVIAVTSGATFSYTLGAGANGGTGNGAPGENTIFSNIIAIGGVGGLRSNTNNISSAGGTASTVGCVGSTIFSGGNGGTGASGNSAGGGGEGSGSLINGGSGAVTIGGTGSDGGDGGNGGNTGGNGGNGNGSTIPGGGGGGGRAGSTTDRTGGNGARGQILITYDTPPISNAGPDQSPSCTTTATLAGNSAADYTGLWTCITNCGAISILNPGSPTSEITGLNAGTPVTLQWVLTYSTGCSLTPDNVTITLLPCPPLNDDPPGAIPISPGSTCTFTTFTNVSATASSCGTIPAPGCGGYSGGDVWFSVTVPASGTFTLDSQSGVMTDGAMALYSGTTCGVLTLISCDDNTGAGNMPRINASGQTPGDILFVRFWENGNNNNGTFGLCITTDIPPINDNPTGATPISPNSTCNFTTFTNAYASASSCGSITAPGCGGYSGGDVWFSLTVPASGSFSLNSQSGVMTDGAMALYSGTPCGTLTLISCDDNTGAGSMPRIYASGQTPGATLYVRFWENGNNNNGTFDICCYANVPPANDECTGAYTVTVNTGATCTALTSGSVLNATASSNTNTCGGSADDDVWYSFIATSNTHSVSLTNISGSTTDLYHSVYNGSCGSLGSPIICSDPNSSSLTGLTIGNTYYIRVYTLTGTTGQTTAFNVCITIPVVIGPCGNPINNDYCSNPAVLSIGVGTFSSTTSSMYTVDQPGNIASAFCGQIDNNSWYYFVADATTLSLPISSVSGCGSGGIQAEIFAVSQSSLGCCTSFTSVSNCFNPGNVSTGTVTATGLNIGQTYVLMVDGWAGAVCNFVFSGWTAVGILPIELINFSGKNEGDANKIDWTTATELNSDYYILEKSANGVDFINMINIVAAGNSVAPTHYQTFDMSPYKEISYYRLKQFDFNGSFEYSNIIAINNINLTDYISDVIPNPTNNIIRFDVNTLTKNTITTEIMDNLGKVLTTENFKIEDGYTTINLNLEDLNSGIYILKVIFKNSSKTEIKKIIKN